MYSRSQIHKIAQAIIERIEAAEESSPMPEAYSRYALRRLALEKEQISEADFEVYIADLKAARWPASDVAQALLDGKDCLVRH